MGFISLGHLKVIFFTNVSALLSSVPPPPVLLVPLMQYISVKAVCTDKCRVAIFVFFHLFSLNEHASSSAPPT